MIRKEKIEELKYLVEQLKTIEVSERKVEQKNKFLQSKSYNFKLNNGIIIPRERLIKGGNDGSAAIIMPVLPNNEVLTIIEPRVFTELTVGVGFPAGYIEKGEKATIGALRELREETGFVPKEIIEMDSFYQDEGISSALNHIFLALDCEKKFNQELDDNEIVEYMTFNYDELFEFEKMGYIKGCNTKLALEKCKIYMKGR